MSLPEPEPQHAVSRVKPQRTRLRAARLAFEAAFDPALSDGTSPRVALGELRDAFALHVEYAEGPDGLFAAMQYDNPELSANEIDRLRRDHITIADTIERVDEYLDADPGTTDANRLHDAVSELNRLLLAHHRRGTELTYQVYDVDIGGSD
jgi:hypothetical protein